MLILHSTCIYGRNTVVILYILVYLYIFFTQAIDYKKREDQLNKERHKKIMQKIADDKASRAAEKLSALGTVAIPNTALPHGIYMKIAGFYVFI